MAVTTFSWGTPAAIATALSTEWNSLANGNTVLSAAIDNSTTGSLYISVSFHLGSITTGAGAPYIGLWLLSSIDSGTTYEDGTAGTPGVINPRPADIIIPLRASFAGVQDVNAVNVPAPPYNFKILGYSQAGATLAATLNTTKYRLHNEIGT